MLMFCKFQKAPSSAVPRILKIRHLPPCLPSPAFGVLDSIRHKLNFHLTIKTAIIQMLSTYYHQKTKTAMNKHIAKFFFKTSVKL